MPVVCYWRIVGAGCSTLCPLVRRVATASGNQHPRDFPKTQVEANEPVLARACEQAKVENTGLAAQSLTIQRSIRAFHTHENPRIDTRPHKQQLHPPTTTANGRTIKVHSSSRTNQLLRRHSCCLFSLSPPTISLPPRMWQSASVT